MTVILALGLQMEGRVRELALLHLGIDSKQRGCNLVRLKVPDVCRGDQGAARAIVVQHRTQRPARFEITSAARDAAQASIKVTGEAGGLPTPEPAKPGNPDRIPGDLGWTGLP
jgi:hypothetical protein